MDKSFHGHPRVSYHTDMFESRFVTGATEVFRADTAEIRPVCLYTVLALLPLLCLTVAVPQVSPETLRF